MNIRDSIARELDIPAQLIDDAMRSARVLVKKFTIPKKSGGTREIFHPSKKLKVIQYWLIHRVLNDIPIHEASMAYREGISIFHNAKLHAQNRFFLKIDLQNFFSSITFQDFLPILREWHKWSHPIWELDADTEEFINKACFYKNDRLAVGYPSSPAISNIVMREFDASISSQISTGDYGEVIYSRYADDLVFSTNKKGACKALQKTVEKTIQKSKSPKILINHSKTRFGSSSGGSASVTGLKICENGHITIHRKQKDHIRLMLSLFSKGILNENDERSLLGHLGYCHYVAPQFYTTLSQKFFKEIQELRAKNC